MLKFEKMNLFWVILFLGSQIPSTQSKFWKTNTPLPKNPYVYGKLLFWKPIRYSIYDLFFQVRLDRGYAEKDKIEAKLEFSQSELGKLKAELDKSQGDQNLKYNDYNDSRQKIYKYEQEIERLRQENDRWGISSIDHATTSQWYFIALPPL